MGRRPGHTIERCPRCRMREKARPDSYCRECRNQINAEWRESHPEKMRDARDRWRWAQ